MGLPVQIVKDWWTVQQRVDLWICYDIINTQIVSRLTVRVFSEFPSAALAAIDVAVAAPYQAALQTDNLFYIIYLKMNGTVR